MQDLRDLQNSYIQELKKCHVPQVPHYKTACGRKMTNEMWKTAAHKEWAKNNSFAAWFGGKESKTIGTPWFCLLAATRVIMDDWKQRGSNVFVADIFTGKKNERKTTTVFCRKRFYEFGMGPNTFLSAKNWQRQLKPNVAIREWN